MALLRRLGVGTGVDQCAERRFGCPLLDLPALWWMDGSGCAEDTLPPGSLCSRTMQKMPLLRSSCRVARPSGSSTGLQPEQT